MGTLGIPDDLYRTLFHLEVARQIDKGLDLLAARQMAHEIMGSSFYAHSAQVQCDDQKDRDDERQGDWTR